MSKRISLKKLGEKVKKSKSGGLVAGPTQAKRVVIVKKCPREDQKWGFLCKEGGDWQNPKAGFFIHVFRLFQIILTVIEIQ